MSDLIELGAYLLGSWLVGYAFGFVTLQLRKLLDLI